MKKPIYKKVWFWVLIVIVLAGIGSMGGSDKEEVKDTTSDVKQETKQEVSTEAKEDVREYKMNENVNVGDMTYKVTKKTVKKSVGPQYFESKAKDTYIVLNVTVKNNGKEAVMVDSNFFKMLLNEAEYEADSSASMSANTKSDGSEMSTFFLDKLNPGVSLSGKVVFDVPSSVANSKQAKLQVQTGAWGTEKELINLKK